MTIKYTTLPGFDRDFKKLCKRFKTLPEDFVTVKRAAIELFHVLGIDNQSTFEIPGLNGPVPVYKLKKFACRSLKGKGAKSGLRVIYAWDAAVGRIDLIEIYYKGDKANEERSRIREYFKNLPRIK